VKTSKYSNVEEDDFLHCLTCSSCKRKTIVLRGPSVIYEKDMKCYFCPEVLFTIGQLNDESTMIGSMKERRKKVIEEYALKSFDDDHPRLC